MANVVERCGLADPVAHLPAQRMCLLEVVERLVLSPGQSRRLPMFEGSCFAGFVAHLKQPRRQRLHNSPAPGVCHPGRYSRIAEVHQQ